MRENEKLTVIPNTSGIKARILWLDEKDEPTTLIMPIIAWQVFSDEAGQGDWLSHVAPIYPDNGHPNFLQRGVVLYDLPDGTIIDPLIGQLVSSDELGGYLKRIVAARQKQDGEIPL